MKRLERIAAHLLFFCVFLAIVLNLSLIFNIHVNSFELPGTYVLYILGLIILKRVRRQKITWQDATISLLVPLTFLLLAIGLGHLYDSSWDGQDYHADAVIALSKGWDPWKTGKLPIPSPNGGEYVVGYPKTTWLIQASIYKVTGRLNSAAITNVIVASIAFVFVLVVLRRLKLSLRWAVPLAALTICEVHFLQQITTLMGDGYGYELALIAIAAMLRLMLDKDKGFTLAIFLSTWLLLAGSKFSNLVMCGIAGVIVLIYFIKANTDKYPQISVIIIGFFAAAFLTLWVPYGRNMNIYKSPIYPQNLPSQSAQLQLDNVPNNIKHTNRLELLFYGIFSRPEPVQATSDTSQANVAQLKMPFTFENYEIGQINDYQGRVGSSGVLFSGLIVLSIACLIGLGIAAKSPEDRRTFQVISLIIGLIVIGALTIPVPNKLRYSPMLSLIPILVCLALALHKRPGLLMKVTRLILILLIAANTLIAGVMLGYDRVQDTKAANAQFTSLEATHATYQVHITSFYSSLTRLGEHHIPYVRVTKLTCKNPQPLALSFGTTFLCKE